MQQDNGLAALLIGQKTESRFIEYTWRDTALYALAVGAGAADLEYIYEQNMKAIPTFGVIPCWEAIRTVPRLTRPSPAALFLEDHIKTTVAPLHMEHELVIHRPIDPIKGTFVFQDVITDVYDRGKGKGAVIRSGMDVHDEAGNLVCTNNFSTLYHEAGGFGGKPMPANPVKIPERLPDVERNDRIGPTQNALYRLTGDTNLVHMDPDIVRERGFDRVFMQGLCSFGFACRLAISTLTPGEPERMTRIAAQMRSILYPATDIKLQLWKMDDNKACFRLINQANNAVVLERGLFEWK